MQRMDRSWGRKELKEEAPAIVQVGDDRGLDQSGGVTVGGMVRV